MRRKSQQLATYDRLQPRPSNFGRLGDVELLVTLDRSERSMRKSILPLALVFIVVTEACAQDVSWPPVRQKESEFGGRKLEVFRHGSIKEWGYAEPQQDTFLILHPTEA